MLRGNSDLNRLSNSSFCSFNTLLPNKCLFCNRRFISKSGLGLYKKSRHLDEYLLEIEHKYANRRNLPWDEEELRILYEFEQDLIGKGVRFLNIELQRFINHRTHSRIAEIRKSRRYKNLKEKLSYEFFTGGDSPPYPAVLLSPAPCLQLTLPNDIVKQTFSLSDTPRTGRPPANPVRSYVGALSNQIPPRLPEALDLTGNLADTNMESANTVSLLSVPSFADTSSQTPFTSVNERCSTQTLHASYNSGL